MRTEERWNGRESKSTNCGCSKRLKVSVGIVEDDAILRRSLARLVADTKGMQWLATCATGEESLLKLPPHQPQVVLMDLNLPQIPGTKCIRRLKEILPKTQVIVLTVYEDSEHIFRALKAGASGYLLK